MLLPSRKHLEALVLAEQHEAFRFERIRLSRNGLNPTPCARQSLHPQRAPQQIAPRMSERMRSRLSRLRDDLFSRSKLGASVIFMMRSNPGLFEMIGSLIDGPDSSQRQAFAKIIFSIIISLYKIT